MKTILVTGSAGFIGYFVCKKLLEEGLRVVGVDCMTSYYDVKMKEKREEKLVCFENYRSIHSKIEEPDMLNQLFCEEAPDVVIHLAAQAGVRYSIKNPREYLDSNIVGTFELLEAARSYPPAHMLLASTSSVYGANHDLPYSETDKADHQMSFYAATKKATESMAHSYAHLFDLPITMFRFFTAYGPWGRPDMAVFKFTESILAGNPIDVFNYGNMRRDFTYIDDLVHAIRLLIEVIPSRIDREQIHKKDNLSPVAPFRCVNIGNSNPGELLQFIKAIEDATGIDAVLNFMPMQAGDVPATWADGYLLKHLTGYAPQTPIKEGVTAFVDWYRDHHTAE